MRYKLLNFLVGIFYIISFVSAAYASDLDSVSKSARAIAENYYANGREVALKYPALHNYSDHGIHHAELVVIKSQDSAHAINQAIAENPDNHYYSAINEVELLVAAYMHDTGMDGGIFKDYKDGNALRKDHSLNSAIHVLENREKIANLGVDVDSVAVDCMAHSKSCSGVRDLTSVEQWLKCFERIEEAVAMYNAKYPDNIIYFDKSKWINNDMVNTTAFSQTAALVAALRLGDANREAARYPLTQSGSYINVDFESYISDVNTWQEEVKNSDITLIDIDGNITSLNDDSVDSKGYDKMYSTGEGNLSMNCKYNPNTKAIQEHFKVLHAMSFPLSTQSCIDERLGELDTIKNFPVEAEIQIDGRYLSKAAKRKIMKIYSNYCKNATKQHNYQVKLVFN